MKEISKEQEVESGKELLDNEEGWVVGARGDRLMRVVTDKHMITMAGTGGGKGTSVAIPNLLTHEGSVFSIEIGGATYNNTAKFRKYGLGQDVHLLDPLGTIGEESASINIFDMLDKNSKTFVSDVTLMAKSILKSSEGTKEQNPYWERTPAELLEALILYVITSPDVEDEDRHLPYVSKLLGMFPSEEWNELMEDLKMNMGRFSDKLNAIGNYFHGQDDENIRALHSSVYSALSFTKDPAIADTMKESSFSFKDLRNKKSSIYIVMPDTDYYNALSAWLRILVERAFNSCPNMGDAGVGFEHNDRVLFMLDEFTQLGRVDAIDKGMQTARQKGITIWTLFQDYGRLKEIYGDNIASSFFGAAAVVQSFHLKDEKSLEYLSKMHGNQVSYIPTVSHTVNWSETEGKSWTDTKSTAISKSATKTVNESTTETWGRTSTDGVTEGTSSGSSHSNSNSTNVGVKEHFFGYDPTQMNMGLFDRLNQGDKGYGSSSSHQTNQNVSESKTRSIGKTKGGSKTQGGSESETAGETEGSSSAAGGSSSTNKGGSYTVNYTAQVLPKLDIAQMRETICTGKTQFLTVHYNEKVTEIIDQKAEFFNIPMLKSRTIGPAATEAPIKRNRLLPHTQSELKWSNKSNQLMSLIEEKPEVQHISFKSSSSLTSDQRFKVLQSAITDQDYNSVQQLFGELAPAIDSEIKKSLSVPQSAIKKAKKHRGHLDTYLKAVQHKQDALEQYRQDLNKRASSINDFEETLQKYYKILLDDHKAEGEYRQQTETYKNYLTELFNLRAEWKTAPMPVRPEKEVFKGKSLEADDIEAIIKKRIRLSKFDIPSTPQKVILNTEIVAPSIELDSIERKLSCLGIKMSDGKSYSLKMLDREIEEKSKWKTKLGFGEKDLSQLPLAELKDGKEKLVRKMVAIRDGLEGQVELYEHSVRKWLKEEHALASRKFEDIMSVDKALSAYAGELISIEQQMAERWEMLQQRLAGLNLANEALETRRVDIHNNLVEDPMWDQLEAQEKAFQDQKPKTPKV